MTVAMAELLLAMYTAMHVMYICYVMATGSQYHTQLRLLSLTEHFIITYNISQVNIVDTYSHQQQLLINRHLCVVQLCSKVPQRLTVPQVWSCYMVGYSLDQKLCLIVQ